MYFLIWLMVLHFVADFILQSREMGKKKSSEVKWLLKHLAIQFSVFFVGVTYSSYLGFLRLEAQGHMLPHPWYLLILASAVAAGIFSFTNALVHGLIDWNIWKLYKISAYMRIKKEAKEGNFGLAWIAESSKNWQYWEDHWFYTTIGFDQLLHVSTLIVLGVLFGF